MLRLNKPFGYNTGVGIKLIRDDKSDMVSFDKIAILLLGFSCHPFAISKIYNCLKYSGEYTCFLQSSWFLRRYYHLELLLKDYNIALNVFFYSNFQEEKETKKIYEIEKDKLENYDLQQRRKYFEEVKEKNIKDGTNFIEILEKRGIKIVECA